MCACQVSLYDLRAVRACGSASATSMPFLLNDDAQGLPGCEGRILIGVSADNFALKEWLRSGASTRNSSLVWGETLRRAGRQRDQEIESRSFSFGSSLRLIRRCPDQGQVTGQ